MAQDESTTDDAVLGEGSASQDGTPAEATESRTPVEASACDTLASDHLPPVPQELDDLRVLKALAQPRRQQILQHLTVHGPATSATLARALGLNTGATSYHLRELERYGFVEETPGPGHGRERWWRLVPGDRRFPPRSRQSAETRLAMDELNHHAYAADLELFAQLQRETDLADAGEWADAFPYSRGTMRLTVTELREFFEEYIALLNRYKRPDADTPPGARTVLTRFLAFPTPMADEAADNRKGPETP
ncbi:helix-turn-helix domain-containing protein [Streptomyces flavofungini]|uniref:helix-turn-helix domain-containing protein n=1 Tax=Streptomyces flavofungini TaxID=68200 RepID=UPI0025AF2CF7|nr:helix-turn-helix domain-containing protein [Streptomyces flavofungini]WJV45770.1 helix-turn-helix domain-containing protein [Streptomyces flavofungini]